MDSFGNIINICDRIGTYNSLEQKMETLKRNCETLHCQEADVNTELQCAESSSGKKRKFEVENWLANVESIKNKVQSMDEEVSGSGMIRRVQLVSQVENLTKEVAGLMEQGNFPEGLTLNALDTTEVALVTTELVGQSFQNNLEIIWGYLMDPEVVSIGVWGMGGVGKTTLATHIHNRVQEHSGTFDGVYWVTVGQNVNMSKLQGDIAKEIHFEISSEDNQMKRAAILSRELRRRKRCVLILDDVWNAICLEKIGVSLTVNGCKVVITTRSLEVCRRLGCQKKVKVNALPDEEAWSLFRKNLGHQLVTLSLEVLEVAKCVARECGGLPLGIITMARCMREVNDVHEWRDALQTLIESKVGLLEEMEEEVFHVLKFSYNRLNDPKVQQCFLYCALYGEDRTIVREVLIQRFIDEGLIETMRSRKAKFDKGHAILNKLVNSCLLEGVECDGGYGLVKMHDLVRDMTLQMMSPQFMVKAGMQLSEIPDGQEWSEDVERVSLMENEIEVIASDATRPRFPKLVTLLLSLNGSLKRIENSFIEHMPALQVLDLSFCTKIEELPNSISNLKNLSALVLHRCSKLQGLPSVSEMKSLKRLDIGFSGIREVPHGLEMLVNLTYLDLLARLNVFPTGILPQLTRLEYLKLQLYQGMKIKGEELIGLKRLTTFEGHLSDVDGFKAYVMSRKRYHEGPKCSYHFVLDDANGHKCVQEEYDFNNLKVVTISDWSISKSVAQENAHNDVVTVEALLKDVQSLQIKSCNGARSLCDLSWLDDVTKDLKQCKIDYCDGFECVVPFSSSSTSPSFLRTLEKLELGNLHDLEILLELKRGSPQALTPPVAAGTVFSSLKHLFLWGCPYIETLFQPWLLPNLKNLEEIRVDRCDEMEEIIAAAEEEASGSSNHIEYGLPNLRRLSLRNLPKLMSICAETVVCDLLCEIRVEKCPELKRIPLSWTPSCFTSICVHGKDGDRWWESVQLDNSNAKNLLQPYLQFLDTEG